MPTPPIDVLVVGAGPTGLSLASELLRHGVSCRLIEQLDAPVVWSKAAVAHARTLEVFDNMGVAPAILEHSKVIRGARIHADRKQIASVAFGDLPTAYPHVFGVSQHDTEAVLASHFARLGGTLERNVKLTSFTQDAQGVRSTVTRADGTTETIESRFVVGCDGSHSTVRHTLGFEFLGAAYEERLVQADVRVDWSSSRPDDEILLFINPEGPLAMFPFFRDGRYRLIVMQLPESPDLAPTLENFQRAIDTRGPPGARVSDPAWMVEFKIHCRRVERYRDRRAFLAGDAAHVHSPVGGQGMNTGIQDAYNLAWKLALVLRERAHDTLLDSYESERLPIAKTLLASTDTATRGIETVFALRNPIAVALRNQIVSLVTRSDTIQARSLQSVSMLDLNYRGSPIVGQDRPSVLGVSITGDAEAPGLRDWSAFGDGPAPGERAKDLALDEAGTSRLFHHFRGTRHTLLLFDGAAATAEGYRNLAAIAQHVSERYRDSVDVHVVIPHARKPDALAWTGSVLPDPDGAIHREYGARSECLYLVRPDQYVAYRCQPADRAALDRYLQRVLR